MTNENDVTCETCEYRKWLSANVDIHIDWWNCWIEDCKYKKMKDGADNA